MHIVHISDIVINAKGGGMNTIIPQLISSQKKRNPKDNISLLLVTPKCTFNVKWNFDIHFLSDMNVKNLLKETDLFVFHSVYNLRFIYLYLHIKRFNRPYIIVSHGGLTRMALKRHVLQKIFYQIFFLNFFIKSALAISFLSEDEHKNSAYFKKKYIIVPNIIPALPNNYRFEQNSNILKIVFMSKIDFYSKGLDMLFEALNLIKDTLKDKAFTLSFYGYGKNKNVNINNIRKDETDILKLYQCIDSLGLSSNIKYLGPVFGEDKQRIMKDADIMILPSRSEGMPLSIIEFLAVGTPCLITENTNMATPIKKHKAGWISKFNSKSLSETMLIAMEDYRQNGLKYRKAARRCYEELASVDIGSVSIEKYKFLLNNK